MAGVSRSVSHPASRPAGPGWIMVGMNTRRWSLLVGGVVVLAVVAFAVFRPDKLVTDQRVDEELDAEVAAAIGAGVTEVPSTGPGGTTDQAAPPTTAAPFLLSRGDFISQAGHDVRGTAAVVEGREGRVLVLPDLRSGNGPDLRLYLSPESSGSVEGGLQLGRLKGNIGTQSYELPDGVDLVELDNVVIWCERFSVPFGTATLAS